MRLLAEMSWEEAKEYLAQDDRIILALGATEQHGRHLGLGTDAIEAEAIARATGEKTNVAVAPTLNYGMSLHHMHFPGTMSLKPTTLIAVLDDLLRALYRHGFRRVLVVNGHGGNEAALTSALHLVADDLKDLRAKIFQWWSDQESYSVVEKALGPLKGSHATAGETAFMLALRPDAVKLKRLTGKDYPVKASREFTNLHSFQQKYSDGIMGLDPSKATREVGDALLAKCVEICARELDEWK